MPPNTPVSQPSPLLEADQVVAGRYRIDAPIAQGGMGSVWRALDERAFDQPVAIKIIRAQGVSERVKAQFMGEAQVISRLNSPHVVGLREFGITDAEFPFFVMDLLEGQTVSERLASNGPCGEREGARILDELLAGLQEIHTQGVVHRDIKPSNVFLEQSSAIEAHVRILDLGIAQLMGDSESVDGSRRKRVVGTPRWMAPEVLMGEPSAIASDLYSVGLLGVYLLGGEVPHSRVDADGVLQPFDRACIIQRLGVNSVKVNGRRGMEPISDAFCHVLEDALWREPADRYNSAIRFREALREAMPDLGLPNLPLRSELSSAANFRQPEEHTVLDMDAADSSPGLSELLQDVSSLSEFPLEGTETDLPSSDVRRDDGKPRSEAASSYQPKAESTLFGGDVSTDANTETRVFTGLKVVIIGTLVGVGLAYFGSERLFGIEQEQPLIATVLPTEVSDAALALDIGEVSDVDVTKLRDVGVSDQSMIVTVPAPEPSLLPEKKVSTAKQVRRSKTGARKKRKAARDKRSNSVNKRSYLGHRCKRDFDRIVRDSPGQTLRNGSPLCARIKRLVVDSSKVECKLSAKDRAELQMIQQFCLL